MFSTAAVLETLVEPYLRIAVEVLRNQSTGFVPTTLTLDFFILTLLQYCEVEGFYTHVTILLETLLQTCYIKLISMCILSFLYVNETTSDEETRLYVGINALVQGQWHGSVKVQVSRTGRILIFPVENKENIQ